MGSRLLIPASGTVGIDTAPIIYSIERHPVYYPLLEPLWIEVEAGNVELLVSELVLAEALVMPYKSGDSVRVLEYEGLLAQPNVRLVPVSSSILRDAAKLRSQRRLKTPDAIHAATALSEGCATFVANDASFRTIPGLPLQLLKDLVRP